MSAGLVAQCQEPREQSTWGRRRLVLCRRQHWGEDIETVKEVETEERMSSCLGIHYTHKYCVQYILRILLFSVCAAYVPCSTLSAVTAMNSIFPCASAKLCT